MTSHVEAEFEIASWDEKPFDEGVGVAKLTEALVAKKYSGSIDATSTTKWLMAYAPDKTATFVGIERIKGTVDGKHGSLVVLHDGVFKDGAATASLRIVSGTDELKGMTGKGTFKADPAGSVTLELDPA
ncbi:MAG: hypothetical protein QOD90_2165 [Mycobacterium sp.]|jgi:hypothetical protein|nr:hypothetical protein [Mycobacterium sp.]